MNVKLYFILLLGILLLKVSCTDKSEEPMVFAIGGTPNEVDYWEGLAEKFAERSGIKLEIRRHPTDTDLRRQGLVISLAAGESDPDIFLMDIAWLGQFAASGWLEPLDHCLEHGTIKTESFFEEVVLTANRYRDTLIAFPVYIDGGLLYYRSDLLAKYGYDGPPDKWAELVKYAEVVQAGERMDGKDFYGFVWQGAQYEGLICNFLEFAVANNGGISFHGDSIQINCRANIEALNFMRNLIEKYNISPPNTFIEMKEEETRLFFQRGRALFMRNWPYAWSLMQQEDSEVKDRVGIAALPFFEGGRRASTLGGWHVGISRFSDQKMEALEFLKYILSYEVQKSLAQDLGWNPGRQDIYSDKEVLEELPHFAELKEIFEGATARPTLPYYTQISEVLQRYINAVLAGEMDSEKALAEAEVEAQKIINRYEGHRDF